MSNVRNPNVDQVNHPPHWAVEKAGLSPKEIIVWVKGSRLRNRNPPVFMLTEHELLWARSGWFSPQLYRVPRCKVTFISYDKGTTVDDLVVTISDHYIGQMDIQIGSGGRANAAVLIALLETSIQKSPISNPISKTVADLIRQLVDLRDEGLISDTEFETKRIELLDRM